MISKTKGEYMKTENTKPLQGSPKQPDSRLRATPDLTSPRRNFWTEGQVATRLGVSVQFLRKQRGLGEGIRVHRFGRAIRYRISDVLAYEEESIETFTGQT